MNTVMDLDISFENSPQFYLRHLLRLKVYKDSSITFYIIILINFLHTYSFNNLFFLIYTQEHFNHY